MKTTGDLGDLRGKRVLVRSDLNVPLDGTTITDDGRIRASAPTIKGLADAGARVIVCAHLGRPKGAPEARYSLAPVADRLGEVLGTPVVFADDTVGDDAQAKAAALEDGQVLLLENLRFNAGETAKTDEDRAEFAGQLASLADVFVSDGFGVVHRKQASVYDVARLLPHATGDLVSTEVDVLRRLTKDPERPYAVVLGGAKVSDKLGVIGNLLGTADRLLIGGGMVFTFLAAQGHEVGKSLLEADQIDTVKGYLERAEKEGVEIVLPVDVVAADAFSADAAHDVVAADAIPADRMGLDIGPESSRLFAEKLVRLPHGLLERPHGCLRDGAVCRGHQGPRPGTRRRDVGGRADRRRWRRLGRRRAPARLPGLRLRPHLDRWRGEPRVPRGQGAARSHGPRGG